MTRGDRHRLLDMQEAADDLLMWEQLVTQLLSLREALGRIDPDDLEEG